MASPITSLRSLDNANFRTTKRADALNDQMQTKLGFRYRYEPARLALARSLELENPPRAPEGPDTSEPGKPILGRHLFGEDELPLWLTLMVERANLFDPTLDAIQEQVRRHWHRGIILLSEEWEHCGSEYERFLLQIAERAGLANFPSKRGSLSENRRTGDATALGPVPVVLDLGTDPVTRIPITWTLNGRGGSPHVAIMGTLGTGKTRTAMQYLRQIARTTPASVLLFDMAKGDLTSDKDLVSALDATVIESPRMQIPLDVLALPSRDPGEIADAAMRFRESFVRVARSKPGGMQLDFLREAAQRALRGSSPITIADVGRALQDVYGEARRKADAVTATFNDLTSRTLFEPSMSSAEFFSRNWIIDVHGATETAQRFIVFLVLDALYTHLRMQPDSALDPEGHRELRLVVGIDEARKVLGYKQPSLSSLVRESRSKGASIFLISQSPDDYDQEDDNFMENVGLALCFKTNTTTSRVLKSWLGQQVDLGALPTGVAVTRLPGQHGVARVKTWE